MIGWLLMVTLSASQSVFSPNQQFQGIIEYTEKIDLTTRTFTLLNAAGETLYTKISPPAITFYVNNPGTVFAADEGNLFYYNTTGQDTILKNLHYPNGFGFSPDYTVFFASDKDGLNSYGLDGRPRHIYQPCRLFASAENEMVVAAVVNDTLTIYHDGQLRFTVTLATPYIHEITITPDGRIITLKEPEGIELFDAITGKKLEAP